MWFTDCRTAEDARRYVQIVRPETPQDGGLFGSAPRRFSPRAQVGGAAYLQALRDVVDLWILRQWWTANGKKLREALPAEWPRAEPAAPVRFSLPPVSPLR